MHTKSTATACLLMALAACSSETRATTPWARQTDQMQSISVRVAGFVEAAGITWMDWPNKVKEALDGLPGVQTVAVDLEDDRFDITFDPQRIAVPELLDAVRKSGFEPELLSATQKTAVEATRSLEQSKLPSDVRALLAKADANDKLVLLRFSGPGWPPCKQMDAVTYPHNSVQQELAAHWLTIKIDVAERPDVADACSVTGIPAAVAVAANGRVLATILGFAEAADFQQRLVDLRKSK